MNARCIARSSTSNASFRYLMSSRLLATDSGMSFIGGFEALKAAMAAASRGFASGPLSDDDRGGGRMTVAPPRGRAAEGAAFLDLEAEVDALG